MWEIVFNNGEKLGLWLCSSPHEEDLGRLINHKLMECSSEGLIIGYLAHGGLGGGEVHERQTDNGRDAPTLADSTNDLLLPAGQCRHSSPWTAGPRSAITAATCLWARSVCILRV